jgi:uncharacterized membrane protein YbhN (UPF0104 family)
MIRILDFASLGVALLTAIFLLIIMFRWPPERDPRPLAPALALALAFFALRLPTVMGWEGNYTILREYAWNIWYIIVFVNSMLFAYLQGRCRQRRGCRE